MCGDAVCGDGTGALSCTRAPLSECLEQSANAPCVVADDGSIGRCESETSQCVPWAPCAADGERCEAAFGAVGVCELTSDGALSCNPAGVRSECLVATDINLVCGPNGETCGSDGTCTLSSVACVDPRQHGAVCGEARKCFAGPVHTVVKCNYDPTSNLVTSGTYYDVECVSEQYTPCPTESNACVDKDGAAGACVVDESSSTGFSCDSTLDAASGQNVRLRKATGVLKQLRQAATKASVSERARYVGRGAGAVVGVTESGAAARGFRADAVVVRKRTSLVAVDLHVFSLVVARGSKVRAQHLRLGGGAGGETGRKRTSIGGSNANIALWQMYYGEEDGQSTQKSEGTGTAASSIDVQGSNNVFIAPKLALSASVEPRLETELRSRVVERLVLGGGDVMQKLIAAAFDNSKDCDDEDESSRGGGGGGGFLGGGPSGVGSFGPRTPYNDYNQGAIEGTDTGTIADRKRAFDSLQVDATDFIVTSWDDMSPTEQLQRIGEIFIIYIIHPHQN